MEHVWNWSDIVNPQLVERALAEEKRRAEKRARAAARGPANDHYVHLHEGAPEAA